MMDCDETQGHGYTLIINGLFGRNRKVKREFLKMVKFTETEIADTDLAEQVQAMLAEIKAKPGLTWQVERDNIGRSVDKETGTVWHSHKIIIGGGRDIKLAGKV